MKKARAAAGAHESRQGLKKRRRPLWAPSGSQPAFLNENQERRRRANPMPNNPRPKRERLAGSGTPCSVVSEKMSVMELTNAPPGMVVLLSAMTVPAPGLNMTLPVWLLTRGVGLVAMPLNVVTVEVAGFMVPTSIPTLASRIEWVADSVTKKSNVSVPGAKVLPSLKRVTAFIVGLAGVISTSVSVVLAPLAVKLLNVESPSVQLNPAARAVASGMLAAQTAALA